MTTNNCCCLCNIELEVVDVPGIELLIDAEPDVEFSMGDAVLGSYAPVYHGETEVIPRLDTIQTLLTEGKKLESNITVREIPITQTTNPYGGKTVVIG